MDDEEAVQRELAELQAEATPPGGEPLVVLPNVPGEEPISQGLSSSCQGLVLVTSIAAGISELESTPAQQERAKVPLEA